MEVNEIRKHVREDFWKTDGGKIEEIVKKRQGIRDEYKKLLGGIARTRGFFSAGDAGRGFSKIKHYENRILFAAETVPMEILEKEIQYYTEQRNQPARAGLIFILPLRRGS